MVAVVEFDLPGPVRAEPDCERDPAGPAETNAPAAAEQELQTELGGEPVSYPSWRIAELREKYAARDAYEPNEVCDDEREEMRVLSAPLPTFRGRPLEYTRVDPLDPRRGDLGPIASNE